MHFNDYVSRKVTLKKASHTDLNDYLNQTKVHRTVEDKLNILNTEDVEYIAIKAVNNKNVGLIQLNEIDANTAYIKISIPNISWAYRYGKEAIHQFLNCCEERKLYKRIYVMKDNKIISSYIHERPERFGNGLYVDIA